MSQQRINSGITLFFLLVVIILIGNHQFHLPIKLDYEVVTTPEEMAKGLSGRDHLDHGHGMLFKWKEPGIRCMWGKGMKFDIELFFLDDRGDSVGRIIMKAGETEPLCSPVPVRYALETNVGEVK